MNQKLLEKFANLIIEVGVNLQKDEYLIIQGIAESLPLLRLLQEKAFEHGAKDVMVKISDPILNRNRFLHAKDEVLFSIEDDGSFQEMKRWSIEYKAAKIAISSPTPGVMDGVDSKRLSQYAAAMGKATEELKILQMNNTNKWCICAYPNERWAKQVFPDLDEKQAFDELLKLIYHCSRVSENNNPVEEQKANNAALAKRNRILNEADLKALHFTSSLGTDLEVGLPEGYLFLGGSEKSKAGCEFQANIPTEESFSAPHRTKVNGRVCASKPLLYNDFIIENICIDFKDGKAVKASATQNEKVLHELLKQDENASYLGEVALVPHSSPISQTNRLFYNTLFDENASCHLALGMAYPVCLKGGEDMSTIELTEHGLNCSNVHVDFMFGTSDMTVKGIRKDGSSFLIMDKGEFCI